MPLVGPVVVDGLHELGARVHHEGPVLEHGFLDGDAGDEEELRAVRTRFRREAAFARAYRSSRTICPSGKSVST